MDNDELFTRIFNKIDAFENRLDTTCTNVTEIKITLNNFIEAVEKREQEAKEALDKKYKNITLVFGSITSVSVLVGLSKVFGIF
jgi:regulator of replication initiation timing